MIEIYTFGDWDIRQNDISILEPKASQQRLLKLLKYFLTFEGKKVTRERICEDLLIDTTSYNPRNIIRTQISRLRSLFEEYEFYSIKYIAGYYIFNVKENCTLDFKEFEKLIEEGNALMKTGQREYAISHYEYYTAKIHNDLRIAPSNYMKELYSILQYPNYSDKYTLSSDLASIENIFQRNCKCNSEEFCNVQKFNLLSNDESSKDMTLTLKDNYLMLITLEGNMGSQLQGIEIKENMAIINRILQSNLRSEDRFFQCQEGPMIILFHDVSLEVLQMIAKRLQNKFREEVKSEDILLNIKYKSV